ncbi:hypothetical protein ACJMK2_031140 [Sinanodonta woodiana]|uniref:Mitochondria-eating protein n=1 Tax=Sinanodonta woodiana TaxID=1069815 RepID=A0ABD3X1A9_SINWO
MSHENLDKCFTTFENYNAHNSRESLATLNHGFMQKVVKNFTDGNHQISDHYKDSKFAFNGLVLFLDHCQAGRWSDAAIHFNQAKAEYKIFTKTLGAISKNADNFAKYNDNSVATKTSTTDLARTSTDRDKSRNPRVTIDSPIGNRSAAQALGDNHENSLTNDTGETLLTNAATPSNQGQSVQQISRHKIPNDSIQHITNAKAILQNVTPVSSMEKNLSSPEYHTHGKSKDANISKPKMIQVSRTTSVPSSTTDQYYDHESDETDIYRRSEKARILLHENNPNIVDLSDPNRPTKLAERFSELYSNEHTDTFEELFKCYQQGKIDQEEKIVNDLLVVVQKAYDHCKNWNMKLEEKLKSEEMTVVPRTEGEEIQRRGQIQQKKKRLVQENVIDVVKDFMANKIQIVCPVNVTDSATRKYMKYAKTTVEIVWWMCVQDPPIQLEYAKSGSFDSNLYRSYTKSGSFVDFCVWPLVRLCENGPILTKGIAQGTNK